MNKIFLSVLLVSLFSLSLISHVPVAQASDMSISELVELLITTGVIDQSKATAARNAVALLGQKNDLETVNTAVTYVQVLSPKSGDSWLIDEADSFDVTWGSTGIDLVRLALVGTSTKAAVCDINQSPISSIDGENTFTMQAPVTCLNSKTGTTTPLISGSYKLRVYGTDVSGKKLTDDGESFKILIPTLALTSPNGGETLSEGTYYPLKYDLKNATEANKKVYLIDYSRNNVYPVTVKETINGKVKLYSVRFPTSITPGAYKLKMDLNTEFHNKLEDQTDNYFWVTDTQ